MTITLAHLADLVAITVLVAGLFVPRHGRRELVVAYLVVNVGVMVIATTLASTTVGAGLGLGIFGVLSIIRLRSEELSQSEVAYYFAALALGLLAGLAPSNSWVVPAMMAGLVAVLWIGDHPRVARRSTSQEIVLDRAYTEGPELTEHLRLLLGFEPTSVDVRRTDLVDDTTVVLVRYVLGASSDVTPPTTPVVPARTHLAGVR